MTIMRVPGGLADLAALAAVLAAEDLPAEEERAAQAVLAQAVQGALAEAAVPAVSAEGAPEAEGLPAGAAPEGARRPCVQFKIVLFRRRRACPCGVSYGCSAYAAVRHACAKAVSRTMNV